MSNGSATMNALLASNAKRGVERHHGLLEALATLGGFALALTTWYGLNLVMKLSALNVTAMIAD